MTAQAGERLIYKGKEFSMASEPLNQYLQSRTDINFVSPSTACWRGYYGKWEIVDNKLYLVELEAYLEGYREVDISYLFPEKDRVFADWFSGKIRIPEGKMLEYVHMGYASIFEKDLILVIKNGIIENQYEVDNEEEYQQRIKRKEQDEIDQIEREAKKKKKDKISTVTTITIITIVFTGICIGLYYLVKLDTTLAYVVSAAIIFEVILIIGGVLSLVINKEKQYRKEQDKTVAFIAINFLVLVFIGICIGLYYLLDWGTIWGYLLSVTIVIGVGYLIFITIMSQLKNKKNK